MKKIIVLFTLIWGVVSLLAPVKIFAASLAAGYPSQLVIPSIKLAAPIRPVGLDLNGAMAVPTVPNTVGWFAAGTMPGEMGSAVLDAHIYLAFRNLKKTKVGDSVYVTTKDGAALRFVVSAIRSYAYNAVPLGDLFALNDSKRLNLITCAGIWLPRQHTYDHRLVVYAELAS